MAEAMHGSLTSGIAAQLAQPVWRVVVVAAGISISIFFLLVGLLAELQMFGDGSIFSYSVAAQEAWSFHWHNISGRLFSYLFAYVPAEAYVSLTNDAKGGIFIYGLLRFSAPLLGLLVTLATDRTRGRVVFIYACLSTACLCPLVFGAPTEMWMAHAVFWPTLAISLSASVSLRAAVAMFAAFLALVFTHEGAVVLSLAILLALCLRTGREKVFVLGLAAWSVAMLIWLVVKLAIRPDDYIAGVLLGHAYMFIDIRNLIQPGLLLLLAALAGYGIAVLLFQRANVAKAHVYAVVGCAAALAVYWLWFDSSLLTTARYDLRTTLLIVTPPLGLLAALHATPAGERRKIPFLAQAISAAEQTLDPRLIVGAILLITLVHAVETSKFVAAWLEYKAALRTLATGTASDPALGDPRFVSSHRLGARLNRLAWNSTIPYLSVLVAPELQPARLVVDPDASYFWLSCATATQSEYNSAAVPAESRSLIRRHACLHR
jgi:hypothetical protein